MVYGLLGPYDRGLKVVRCFLGGRTVVCEDYTCWRETNIGHTVYELVVQWLYSEVKDQPYDMMEKMSYGKMR